MRGYPKHISKKRDFESLLKMPEFKGRALKDLERIYNTEDSKATKATTPIDLKDPNKGWNTIEIDNPMRLFKRFGFETKEEVKELIDEYRR